MNDIKSMTLPELQNWIVEQGEPKYRAEQLYKWMHANRARSFEDMNNIPKALKAKCSELGELVTIRKVDVQISKDKTRKYLFAMSDGSLVESVWMDYQYGASVCISSQVGCRMGCKFCASTLDGLSRNLTASEMLEQIYMIDADTGTRVSHVVVMGTGEPMDNYDNLVNFIKILTSPEGYNLSRRNITVSTCGIVERIKDFADENLGVTLAISLHAPEDSKRQTIMPIALKYSIEELMGAAMYYFEKTGRRVTFEYALAEGVNDTEEDIQRLADLSGRVKAHVNLIPVNPVTERGYNPSSRKRVLAFKNKLENQGINVTIRRELGQDIDGACGQLRKRHLEEVQ